MVYDCIIIGAGAAGLFCGAAFPGNINGLILEKTKRIGTKLLMSGNGQCNITHDGSIKDFISCYGKNGSRMRSCLYRYHNLQLREFLRQHGVETYVREDGKVFPKSMKAESIKAMLDKAAKKNGFRILREQPVLSLQRKDDIWTVITPSNTFYSHAVVVASGGCSYPASGSDGSMLQVLARELQISTVPVKPALSAIKCEGYPFTSLAGISFSQAKATIYHAGRPIADRIDGLLFTHQAFSGPAVMNISKYGEFGDTLSINYLYPLHGEQALSMLKQAMAEAGGLSEKRLAGLFNVPRRFAAVMVDRYGISPKALAQGLTADSFFIASTGSFKSAMATAGGISLDEVNPKTMELKKHPNLYAIGEVLDIDGMTGGYNLQFAYSSGCMAGAAIVSSCQR